MKGSYNRYLSSHDRNINVKSWGRPLMACFDFDDCVTFAHILVSYNLDPNMVRQNKNYNPKTQNMELFDMQVMDDEIGGYTWSEEIEPFLGHTLLQIAIKKRQKKVW